jgi:Fe-S cluster assembly protein SufD
MADELARRWLGALTHQKAVETPEWIQAVQSRALAAFSRHGLPGRKDEHWKYTPLRSLEDRRLSVATPGIGDTVGSETGAGIDNGDGLAGPATFVNGPALRISMTDGALGNISGELPAGVTVMSLGDGLQEFESRLRPHIETLEVSGNNRAFAALNTAALRHGLLIHVADGADAGLIGLHWSGSATGDNGLFQSRAIILLDADSSLTLAEQFGNTAPAGESGAGLNLVTQIEIASKARLNHIRFQSESDNASLITETGVIQGEQSNYAYTGFDFGGGLVRHDISSTLAESGAEAEICGAFVLDGRRHVDNHILIDHVAEDCTSRQFFRGVLGGRSRGVFNGKAIIRQGADGARVRQSNANLLLSPLAEIDTKPELEIYADEVEASHGATVGQLDESALFYMQTRGLDRQQAKQMLTTAFCNSVIERIAIANIPGADQLDTQLLNRELIQAMPVADEVLP